MKRILTLWAALGVMYVAAETVFRGYSHPSMLIVGGLCGVLVGAINQRPRFYNAPVVLQSAIGAGTVLAMEFLAGCVLNLWLGLGVWDYTGQPGNIMGQVCPMFGLLWFLIMPLAIWAEDTGNWLIWFYEVNVHNSREEPPEWEMYSLKSVYADFLTGK
ncbi:MAG: putative ABC transporter permease [Ruminococcus flavefaciens]|nr:putative ABC transporter permease [Ruminococcus flavefaciens]